MLTKRQEHLEEKVKQELTSAKLNANKNKRAALLALKRKKQLEEQITVLDHSRLNVETMVFAIEGQCANITVLDSLKEGSHVLSQMQRQMGTDDVEDTMEDIRESMEVAEEISEAVSRPLIDDDVTNKEIEDELKELQREEVELLHNVRQSFPDVPKQKLQSSTEEKEVDEELAALGGM